MRVLTLTTLALTALLSAGCHDDEVTAPRDVTPPAAPRGVYSVTGDGEVTLHWLGNTEPDVAGYKIYISDCPGGPSCRYDFVGATTGTTYRLANLANGVTRYFDVSAFDRAGNESAPSTQYYPFDTPRPAGTGVVLGAWANEPNISGWDFSAAVRRPYDDANTDIYFGTSGSAWLMFTAFTDTDIQDAGYATSLDAVDWAPDAGWSPTGSVELIAGHNYVVWTYDNHYAKFRVVSLSSTPDRVVLDWAYQTSTGNPELKARRVPTEGPRVRRVYQQLASN